MKRAVIIFAILFLVVLILAAVLLGIDLVKIKAAQNGSLVFTIGKNSVNSDLASEDLDAVMDLFNGKVCTYDNPSCGFGEEFQIIIHTNDGSHIFYIAQDSCGIVYWKNKQKYFRLSDRENTYLRSLLNKTYGCDCRIQGQ